MHVGTIIGWVVAGLIVGFLARFLLPGRQDMGVGLTIILGIVGAVVGGFISSLMFGPNMMTDGTYNYAVATAWPGWIMAILGGVLVLWLVTTISGANSSPRS